MPEMSELRDGAPGGASTALAHAIATLGPYDLYLLVVSTLALLVLAVDSVLSFTASVHALLTYTDTLLCILFFADFLRNLFRAPSRWGYLLRGGWLDLVSSVPTVGFLRLGRLFRIARTVRLLRALRSFRTIGIILTRHRRQSALLAAGTLSLMMVVFASFAILQLEQHPESNIRTGGDALWWAFATITTVGYGDHYPVTFEGRLVATMLMAAGVGLFGMLSGLVASWFLHEPESAEGDQGVRLELARLREAVERLAREAGPGDAPPATGQDANPAGRLLTADG